MKKKEIMEVFRGGNFMSLSLKERKIVVKELSENYRKARKRKEKY